MSIIVYAVHFEVSFAVSLDQRPRDQRHEGDGEELGQRSPGENVILTGDLGQDGARADTDEVVRDQTWTEGVTKAGNGTVCVCVDALCAATVCVWSHLWAQRRRR